MENQLQPIVFPAHAGMFRVSDTSPAATAGFPRARGDVPRIRDPQQARRRFSPRTRGCSGEPS